MATAAHVALYNFDVPTRRWTRKDVEGSLFLVKRRGSPRFQIVILNKKSADNYVEDVGGGFQCELNPPYLLYRNKIGEVVGIWFFEEADGKRMHDILSKISSTFAAPSDAEAGVGNGTNGSNAPSSQPSSPAYAYTAAAAAAPEQYSQPAAADDSYEQESGQEDDGIFWDKRVEVPAELGMPGSAGAAAPVAEAPVNNALAGLFAGLKVAAQPAPQAATPSAMPLLTPQFLLNQQQQQQQQTRQSSIPVPTAPTAPENQGAILLQSLRSSSSNAMPAPTASSSGPDAGKVSALLRALAENEVFCKEVAKEMKQAGL